MERVLVSRQPIFLTDMMAVMGYELLFRDSDTERARLTSRTPCAESISACRPIRVPWPGRCGRKAGCRTEKELATKGTKGNLVPFVLFVANFPLEGSA